MFINILNASVAAVWLILAVMVLRLLLTRAPRWICVVLWGMVGLRLVMPFSFKSVFSLIPSGQTLPQTISYDPVPQINSGIPVVNDSVNTVLSDHFAATPQNSANPMQILLGIAEILWVAGMVIMALYLVVSYIALKLKMRTSTRLRDNIMQSERVTSPFVMGIFRPTVYLPYGMESTVEEYVIAHEQSHIRRGDHIVKPAAFLILTLHWFNPLVWLAYVMLCRDIELACDQRVIRDMSGSRRKDYSRALVKAGSSRRLAAACPLAFGEVGVKARVKSVLNYKKPALWIIIGALVLCAVTALCFLTDPIRPQEIFGKRYAEDTLVYESPYLSYKAVPSDEYRLTADRRLVLMDTEGPRNLGRLSETDLSGRNFDEMFLASELDEIWTDGVSASALRRGNRTAWQVTCENRIYYILQQKNDDVYICVGTADPNSQALSGVSRVFRLREVPETEPTDLDAALNKAALDYNAGGYKSGQFRCAAHTLLTTECHTPDSSTCRLTAYALMLYSEYDLIDGAPQDVSGSSIPVAVTFDISASGEYTLVEYWEPDDGTLYAPSLRKKFPAGVTYDTQYLFDRRKAECNRQAAEFFGVPAEKDDALDTAIRKAVWENNYGGMLGGQFQCSAYTILATEQEQSGENRRLTIYAIVLYEEYGFADGVPQNISGRSSPVSIAFDVSADGEYTLAEYWELDPKANPEAGFPAGVDFGTEEGNQQREAECYRQACEYFGVAATTTSAEDDRLTMTTTAIQAGVQPEKTRTTYVYNSEQDIFGPCELTLVSDGTAVLTFGYLSSYVAMGTYKQEGRIITLTTSDGLDKVYTFSLGSNERMVFIAESSSPVPRFKPSQSADPLPSIPDRSEFIFVN